MQAQQDWGLEFWLYIEDAPTGAHRGLFFKGDVDRLGGQRTPSAWLAPDSNKVALRVSTDKGLDIGADTDTPLPYGSGRTSSSASTTCLMLLMLNIY